jgi:DNA processing protein
MKSLIGKHKKRSTMESAQTLDISSYPPSVLLGRSLNDIERKYAQSRLYVSGPMEIPIPRPRVAIVGSRQATPQGIADADLITRILVGKGVTIVSGLAKGIDTAAHEAAIRVGGQTIAVLGTPLDRVYPQENAELQNEIIRHQLAVSQYRVGSIVRRSNFVLRNRTMALIADASIIVQAGEGSGSLSQGWEALRLGRPLFIWKPIFESSLHWPKEMAKYGAIMLSDPKDVLENLPSAASVLRIRI